MRPSLRTLFTLSADPPPPPPLAVVLKTSNQPNWSDITKSVCSSLNIEAVAVQTGYAEKGADFGSPDIAIINHAPRVAMLTGEQVASLS